MGRIEGKFHAAFSDSGVFFASLPVYGRLMLFLTVPGVFSAFLLVYGRFMLFSLIQVYFLLFYLVSGVFLIPSVYIQAFTSLFCTL